MHVYDLCTTVMDYVCTFPLVAFSEAEQEAEHANACALYLPT